MLPPGKFSIFQPLRLFLVASETPLLGSGRSVSVISTVSPPFSPVQDGGCVPLREAENNLWVKNKQTKNCQCGHSYHSNFSHVHVYVLHIRLVTTLKGGGGSQLPMGGKCIPCPLNATLRYFTIIIANFRGLNITLFCQIMLRNKFCG